MDRSLGDLFSGKSVWTNGAERLPKVSPETGIGPWMALPSKRGLHTTNGRRPGATSRQRACWLWSLFRAALLRFGPSLLNLHDTHCNSREGA